MRLLVLCWRWGGGLLWFASVPLPFVCVLVSVATGPAPSSGWWFSERQIALLGKTAVLAGASALLAMAPAILVVAVVGRLVVGRDRLGILGLLFLPLFLPPYVHAFGWDGLLSARLASLLGDLSGWVRAAGVWSGWAWPIPAILVAGAWRRTGHAAYQAALLDASAGVAFRRAVLPILAGHAATAGIILWCLFMIEYNVPHACSIQVYATELLAWAQASRHAIDVVWPSLPLLVVVTAGGVAALIFRPGSASADEQHDWQASCSGRAEAWRWAVLGLVVGATVFLPLYGLIRRLSSMRSFVQLWCVYRDELLQSLGVAIVVGVIVVWIGTWLAVGLPRKSVRALMVIATVVLGLMPAALVGEAVLVTYRRIPFIYDQWPVMVLAQAARWSWIGWLAGRLISRSAATQLMEQARTDGAGQVTAQFVVGWRLHWPVLVGTGTIAAAFALAEVAAMSLVRPPGVGWIAQTLMETFHRLEDQMLVTISLVLAAAPLPALGLGWIVWHMRKND